MKPLKRMTISALLAVLLVVSAYLSIPLPISSVAFTAQSLMVMLIGLSMPVNIAFTSVGLYLLLGAIGLPVFSNGTAGLTVLFGPTGGYLFGFLIGVVVMSPAERDLAAACVRHVAAQPPHRGDGLVFHASDLRRANIYELIEEAVL